MINVFDGLPIEEQCQIQEIKTVKGRQNTQIERSVERKRDVCVQKDLLPKRWTTSKFGQKTAALYQ